MVTQMVEKSGPFNAADGVSLKEYFDTRLAALEKATCVASTAMERRLEGMNEFRDTLTDQASRFITRGEMALQLASLSAEIKSLASYRDKMEGKASQSSVNIAYAFTAVGILISLISLLTR